MAYRSLKSIDSALDELESKEGLPDDFDPLADEIEKSLRNPPSKAKPDSVKKRERRLGAAHKGHKAELDSIRLKAENEARRLSKEGVEENRKRCEELKQGIGTKLASGDVEKARIDIDDLILDCPENSDIAVFEGDLKTVLEAQADEADRRKAGQLGPVSELTAIASSSGSPSITLSWLRGQAVLADEFRIVRINVTSGEQVDLPSQNEPRFVDEEVKLGIPYRYAVTPCYRSIPGKSPSVSDSIICTASITEFRNEQAEGSDSFGIVLLDWRNPPWDATAKVETRLVREDGKAWDVSGRDSFEDEDVKAGEFHSYRLEVTVGEKCLDPVECSVDVERIPAPPAIVGASVFLQGGRPRLSIENWPEGVHEIALSFHSADTRYVTREKYGSESVYFHSLDEVDEATLRSVARIGGKHEVFGPASRIARPKMARILYVSIDSRKRSLWSREFGMTAAVEDGSTVPSLAVGIETNGHRRSFIVPSGAFAPGEFFPFPPEWEARRGCSVSVSVAAPKEASGFSIVYRTSRTIS